MPDYCLIAGLGCAALSSIFYSIYRSKNGELQNLQNAVRLEIGPELVKKLQESENNTIPYGAITGEALPKRPSDVLRSPYVPDLYSLVQKVKTFELKSEWSESTRVWFDVKKLINTVAQAVPFNLHANDMSVVVTEPLSASNLELQNVYDRFEPLTHNTTHSIIQWASGEKTKGFQTVEEVLPIGTTLVGIGKISLSKDRIILSPPDNGKSYYLSQLTIDALMRNAQSNKKFWKILSITLAFGGGILLCIALYRYFKKRKERLETEEFFRTLNEGGGFDTEIAGETCVVCLDRPRNVVILDCGHICACRECAEQVTECPVCRRNIARLLPIYRS
ncbi:mitochondrial ubiquitin ligase activator of NFKB 1-like [Actinia tenebrosa]|uniref:RING-type E3 ubiquitin transferase n=1 Tax=Actinia tenebrosa TaxID=6105 RepID=A0A6P8J6U5_ACTTE|nr:mitochondrial ubiquitin ligase activator of NFKB 1-like [Actinia tenebrosa]